MESPITDVYLFLSYPKSANNMAQILRSSKLGFNIHDGFQCHNFSSSNSIAFVDEDTKDSILFKMAQHNIPLVGLSNDYIHPLVQNIISSSPSLPEVENIMTTIIDADRADDEAIDIERLLPGQSEIWSQIKEIVLRSAHTNCSILIHGESGTGKELVAQAIHTLSGQSDNIFVPVNCGAIPRDLIESELFGHEKGSFTGAIAQRVGKFEQVGHGTLFLDEIGDMPFSMQVKLLRVLQEKVFEKIGSNKTIAFKARLISATHQSLSQLVKDEKFREDLFYRLNVIPINLPPLRERLEDLEIIFDTLKQKESWTITLSKSAIKALKQLHWPGNIRQLYNLMARAEVFYPGQSLKGAHIDKLLLCEAQIVKG